MVLTSPKNDIVEEQIILSEIIPRKQLWTAAHVCKAMESGLFNDDIDWSHLELLEGEFIEKIPQNYPHTFAILTIQAYLVSAFGEANHIGTKMPIHVDEYSEPEPDLMVVSGTPHDYDQHPTGKDVRLVVEVSNSSDHADCVIKPRLYAKGGVPEYWVLRLKSRTLEVRTDPRLMNVATGEYGYQTTRVYTEHDSIAPLS